MTKISISILFFLLTFVSIAQNRIGFNLGMTYGGPIPTEMDTAASGGGLPGIIAGISYQYPITEKLSLNADLLYNLRQFKYSTTQKKDTLVEVDIAGTNALVPTYYTADIQGKTIIHQLDLRLPLNYQINKKSLVYGGPYLSYVLGGLDRTIVNVQIGEGSLIDDVQEVSEGFDNINPFEFGLLLGGGYQFNAHFEIRAEGVRSLTPFYENGYYASINNGKEVKFYQTLMYLRLTYYL